MACFGLGFSVLKSHAPLPFCGVHWSLLQRTGVRFQQFVGSVQLPAQAVASVFRDSVEPFRKITRHDLAAYPFLPQWGLWADWAKAA